EEPALRRVAVVGRGRSAPRDEAQEAVEALGVVDVEHAGEGAGDLLVLGALVFGALEAGLAAHAGEGPGGRAAGVDVLQLGAGRAQEGLEVDVAELAQV